MQLGAVIKSPRSGPFRILEAACGTGTMLERLLATGWLGQDLEYIGIDSDPDNIRQAQAKSTWAKAALKPQFENVDVFDYLQNSGREWDLLIGHAFVDLVPLDTGLPILLNALLPGGHFYFSINFDGLTGFEPPLDGAFEQDVLAAYHQTMDERRVNGQLTAGRASGRKLLSAVPRAGGQIVAVGSSDWIVRPDLDGGYPAREAEFLQAILFFFEDSLGQRPGLDPIRFQRWLRGRRKQIDSGELIYLAHQLDVLGRVLG